MKGFLDDASSWLVRVFMAGESIADANRGTLTGTFMVCRYLRNSTSRPLSVAINLVRSG